MERGAAVSPHSKKVAKPRPPKTLPQSPKRRLKKRKRWQTSSEEESQSDDEGVGILHSLKQKRSISHHSTHSRIEEITLQELGDIETVSRASSVAIREHEHDESDRSENKVGHVDLLCDLKC